MTITQTPFLALNRFGEEKELGGALVTTSLTPVVHSGSTYAPAQANVAANCADLVELSGGRRIESGKVTWTGHGLIVGVYYFLSQTTPGAITEIRPTAGLVQQVLFVEDANTVHIDVQPAGSGMLALPLSRLTTSFWNNTAPWPAGGVAPITSFGQPVIIGERFSIFADIITIKAGGRVRLTGPQGMMSDNIGYNRHYWALQGTTVPYKPAGSNSQQGFAISPNMNFHWSPATAILEFTPDTDVSLVLYSADSSAGFRLNADFGVITCEELPSILTAPTTSPVVEPVFAAAKLVYVNNENPAAASVFSEATASGVLVHNPALASNASYRYITPSGANFTFSGGTYTAYTFPASTKHMMFVRKSTTQSIPNAGGATVINWDAPIENTAGTAFNPTTGVYTVARSGFYRATAVVEFGAAAYTTSPGESRSVNFWVGGSRIASSRNNIQASNTGQFGSCLAEFGPMWLAAGTTIYISAQHQESTPRDLNPFATGTRFTVQEI